MAGTERPDSSRIIRPGPGRESVWDYPRPPRVEDSTRHVRVLLGGVVIADSRRARRVCETSAPPAWYLPPEDVHMELLTPIGRRTVCEFKGTASYYDVRAADQFVGGAAWTYPNSSPGYEAIRDSVAFYPHRLECYVDGERVRSQEGRFYGGWITRDIVGPFKGGPGTENW